jgi:tetratricopeptide (TPR) repeat protein
VACATAGSTRDAAAPVPRVAQAPDAPAPAPSLPPAGGEGRPAEPPAARPAGPGEPGEPHARAAVSPAPPPIAPPSSAAVTPPEDTATPPAAPSVDELAEAVRLAPGSAEARLALGVAFVGRRDLDRGIDELSEALRLLERERAALDESARARAHLAAGERRLARGDMAGAAIALRQALAVEPELAEARAALGLALYGLGNVDGALHELRAVLRLRPDLVSPRLTLASALVTREDWPAARAELERVLEREPDSIQAHLGLGTVRYAQGDPAGAIESYRRVLVREPAHHDARYQLAIVLKLTGRDTEATDEFLAAALAGVPKAQLFLANAYAAGAGVERDLARAIAWWFRAAEQGVTEAEDALAQLRRTALGRGRHAPAERDAAEQAFRDFRAGLGQAFGALSPNGDDSVGVSLLRAGRTEEAVRVLIREALALGHGAQHALETTYERGVEGRLAAHDGRILEALRTLAAEGHVRARLAVARIYGHGLGVSPDLGRAIGLLRATPHEDAQRLLQELSAGSGPARQ